MDTQRVLLTLVLVAASLTVSMRADCQSSRYRVSPPVQHENLSVFLIHGENEAEHENVLTLQEAMDQGLLVVHETSSVNELAVENRSPRYEVFIQSGDIVKGGKQDRVLSVDVIVPANSGKMPIAAFCVEAGRWQPRTGERSDNFASSNERIISKDLKLAANKQRSQSEVWSKVAEVQEKLSSNVGTSVNSAASATSLQLSLENDKVSGSIDGYMKALSQAVNGKNDVVGYAFAINGRINSADVYASNELFSKLWPKLLKASATEAVAESNGEAAAAPATVVDVQALLGATDNVESEERAVTARVKLVTRESEDDIVFEALDQESEAAIHRSYVKKH